MAICVHVLGFYTIEMFPSISITMHTDDHKIIDMIWNLCLFNYIHKICFKPISHYASKTQVKHEKNARKFSLRFSHVLTCVFDTNKTRVKTREKCEKIVRKIKTQVKQRIV